MTMQISVPGQQIPVLAETDVLVCGGGCAGVAAAVSAARHGVGVMLVERWPSVGGMATNALVNGWHRSDREKVVINGLVEESARRAEKEDWIVKDRQYPHAHETHWFDPEGMRVVWQRMLDEAKVRTACYLAVGDPIVENGTIKGVLVDTKLGRRAIVARIVVDATGDGDVAAKAGVPFDFGRTSDQRVQGLTMIFALRNIDETPAHSVTPEQADAILDRMRHERDAGRLPNFNEGNTRHYVTHMVNSQLMNMCPVAGNPLDEMDLSRMTARSREQIVAYLKFWREHIPGMKVARLEQSGMSLGIRESRRIRGRKTLDARMVLGAQKHADAIGHGVWMIDIHDPLGSGHTTYSDRGPKNMLATGASYHIPLSMCLNEQLSNLAAVGRCASSTHEAHSSVRVQTHCMVMGQGVGACAALALQSGASMANVEVRRLQKKLRADGVYLEDVPA